MSDSGAEAGSPADEVRSAADFALEQMLRGLQRQADVLSELRQRASMVLAATGIVASLFGAEALKGQYSDVLAVLATASTGLGIAACIAVLWRVPDQGELPPLTNGRLGEGKRMWKVTLSWRELKGIAANPKAFDAAEWVKTLAVARRVNHETIKKRSSRFLWACWLLLLQLLLWSAVFFERTW